LTDLEGVIGLVAVNAEERPILCIM